MQAMSVALRVRCASARVRSSCNRHLDRQYRHFPTQVAASLSWPSSSRAAYSGLQHSSPDPEANTGKIPETGRKDTRERVVILGSGWAGYVLSRRLDARKYRPIVVSPRTYFVFTPLLNDTATGTLEFRNTLEPVRNKKFKGEYLQGWADDVNFARKTVTVEPSVLDPDVGHALTGERHGNRSLASSTGAQKVPTFEISYDKLVICVGCYSQTFGTKGVRENALFLKDIGDARKIRRRILEIFDLAILPTTTEKVKKNLLHFAVVGGGPTGMEFTANLSDLIRQDLSKLYPSLMEYVRISLYDVAPKVLPMFDAALADYAVRTYKREGIEIKTSHHVEELRKGFPNDAETAQNQDKQLKGGCYTLRTREEGDVGIGMCVWSTGLMMNPFIQKALNSVHTYPSASARVIKGESQDAEKCKWIIHRNPKPGAMIVDDHLRVTLKDGEKEAIMTDVFALGDNATLASGPLPATAQTANQQAHWLAKRLNKGDIEKETFGFRNLGMMTYLGGSKAMLQGGSKDRKGRSHGLKGWLAYLLWRGAYATMTLSWRNRMLVPTQWMVVKIFGRDVSRF